MIATLIAASVAAGVSDVGAQESSKKTPPKKSGGLGGFLDKVDKLICGKDRSGCDSSSTGTAARGATRVGAGSGGARTQVLAFQLEGDSTTGVAFEIGDKEGMRRTRRACGTVRTCVPGWDLRLIEVRPPADTLPGAATIPMTYVVENRGAAPSRPAEVQVCYTRSHDTQGACDDRIEQFDLPALGAGEQIEVTRPLRLKALNSIGSFRLAALIDPDNATGETNRTNNAAVTRPLSLDGPQLQWMAFSAPETLPAGSDVTVEFRVRNRSFVAASQPTEVQWGSPYWGGQPEFRTLLPALAPRQSYVATVRIRPNYAHDLRSVEALVDPDEKLAWGSAHERRKSARIRTIMR